MTFRILFVCTGNLFRSPLAEHIARAALARQPGTDVLVSSAGTHAYDGEPMAPESRAVLAGRGIDGAAFRTRLLVPELINESDLVLTATRAHRAAAAALAPRALARLFTLGQFSRLAAGVDPAWLPPGTAAERAAALVLATAGRRGLDPPEAPADDDLADPIGAPIPAVAACADRITALLERPLQVIIGD